MNINFAFSQRVCRTNKFFEFFELSTSGEIMHYTSAIVHSQIKLYGSWRMVLSGCNEMDEYASDGRLIYVPVSLESCAASASSV